MAVSTVMVNLGAYAFPDCNPYEAKQRLLSAFEPLKNAVDTERILNKAFQLAEAFRRAWNEPGNRDERTIKERLKNLSGYDTGGLDKLRLHWIGRFAH